MTVRQTRFRFAAIALSSLFLAPAAEARGDQDVSEADGEGVRVVVRGVEESGFPEITLDFVVKRGDGTPVFDAEADQFAVEESGAPVEILKFQAPWSREVRPTTIVLVVDRSGSMIQDEDRMTPLKEAVGTFLRDMPPGSRVAVVAFGSEVEVVCPLTDDPEMAREAVEALEAGGGTRYYDAVAEALELITDERGRRAVLAMTDGDDTESRSATLETVIAAARDAGVPVHTLGVGSEDEIETRDLARLAVATRGQYHPVREASALRGIYEEIARDLNASYSLTYRTDRPLPDGTLRPVRVLYRPAPRSAGVASVFIRGMVVPAPGWSVLFLGLLAALVTLSLLPGALRGGFRS